MRYRVELQTSPTEHDSRSMTSTCSCPTQVGIGIDLNTKIASNTKI